MTKFIIELLKSFGQALWTLAAIVCAGLVFFALRGAGHGAWLPWGGALLVVVVFALVFALVPRPWDRD